jgi:hypothetical protein
VVPAYLVATGKLLVSSIAHHNFQKRKTEEKNKKEGNSTWRMANKSLSKDESCKFWLLGIYED